MSEELTLLKQQADTMGLTYSNNIGVDALRKKIQAKLDGKDEEGKDDKDDKNGDETKQPAAAAVEETVAERTQRIRNEQQREELRLIRCRITCLNPAKADLKGEFITVANRYLGTVRKFVPFGDAGEDYHLPKILVDDLKARQFNQVKTVRNDKGGTSIEQRLVNEYAITELTPLTQAELDKLARMQAAKAGE